MTVTQTATIESTADAAGLAHTSSDVLGAHDRRDLRSVPFAGLAVKAYGVRRLRPLCRRVARLEGGPFYSATLREILLTHHGVYVGAYSYGPCLEPGALPRGVRVGRYVSIGAGLRVFLRNHPSERLSMHPFFYNAHLGYVSSDTISTGTLDVGHDAWIGERALVTPGCRRIGIGAVVGAGSVVTKDVPDFAIVAGNPAKVIRMRFEPEVARAVLASQWWNRGIEELVPHMRELIGPVADIPSGHPLLQQVSRSPREKPQS